MIKTWTNIYQWAQSNQIQIHVQRENKFSFPNWDICSCFKQTHFVQFLRRQDFMFILHLK